MKTNFSLFFLCVFALSACNDSNNSTHKPKETAEKKDSASRHKPHSGYSDTLKINSKAAIFFKPDSLQWEKLKAVNDTMIYASFEHDCFFQMRNARIVLKEYFPKIKIIEAFKVRYLLFELADGSTQCIDLDSIDDPCGIFLFDKIKKPHPTDMMNIETESGFYFK